MHKQNNADHWSKAVVVYMGVKASHKSSCSGLQHRWLLGRDAHSLVELWLGDGPALDHGSGDSGSPLLVCSQTRVVSDRVM